MKRWMHSHSIDSNKILKKPLVLAEFGKSNKDSGHSLGERDQYLRKVYESVNKFERTGGEIGMDSYGDGYGIILSQHASTRGVISGESHKMTTLSRMLLRGKHGIKVGFLKAWRHLNSCSPF